MIWFWTVFTAFPAMIVGSLATAVVIKWIMKLPGKGSKVNNLEKILPVTFTFVAYWFLLWIFSLLGWVAWVGN